MKSTSIILFIITGIVFLLQLFPIPGIFLMFFGAPMWSVVTLNLAFAFLAYEVYRQQKPSWVLVFPLVWFGGYLAVAGASHFVVYRQAIAMKAENEKPIAFDAAADALVFDTDYSYLSEGLYQYYDVANVYVVRALYGSCKKDGGRFSFAPLSTCHGGNIETVPAEGGMVNTIANIGEDSQGCLIEVNGLGVDDVCIVSNPAPLPITQRVTIRKREELSTKSFLWDGRVWGYDFLRDGQVIGTLYDAKFTAWPWVPMPVLGCFLNSGAARWQCTANFMKVDSLGLYFVEQETYEMLARKLGLKRRP